MNNEFKDGLYSPYKRDVYFAYLVKGARRTIIDGFPIIEKKMVSQYIPKNVVQFNCRSTCTDKKNTALSFYCEDSTFQCVVRDVNKYIAEFKEYQAVIGLDNSPYDNMPLVVQKSQIYLNLAITYYLGTKGIKLIPNVRLGDMNTISSLHAYPKSTLIAIGTNGFVKSKSNRSIFKKEIDITVDRLKPIGIIIYGPAPLWLIQDIKTPIYRFDSFIQRRRNER